jgi:hypothetical protein
MRTARTLEAEWRQVMRGSVSTGTKEVSQVLARLGCWISPCYGPFSLGAFWNLSNVCFFNFRFFSGLGKPRYWISVYGARLYYIIILTLCACQTVSTIWNIQTPKVMKSLRGQSSGEPDMLALCIYHEQPFCTEFAESSKIRSWLVHANGLSILPFFSLPYSALLYTILRSQN